MYCIYCGKIVKNPEEYCPYCQEALVSGKLDYEETRTLNKALHNRLNASREEVDNAMVFVVLGATIFLVGFLFFFLSFKLPNASAHSKVISFTCFEFYVSMVGLVLGFAGLATGLFRVIRQKAFVQKEILTALKTVQNNAFENQ